MPRHPSEPRPADPAALSARVSEEARAMGFDAVGVTTPDAIPRAAAWLAEYLAAGRHGDMEWMARNALRRSDPRTLWPEARSVVMLGLSYAPARDPLDSVGRTGRGAISAYAEGRDYHDILKSKLKRLARRLQELAACDVKVFVDTAPLMEKPLAAAAGIGWQGKHTNLVSREHGSWLFLGAILTDAELAPDAPAGDTCGSCRRCLDVCPTAAFPAPYQLDARRCLAYLSIEHKGHIAREFRRPMANRIFGCDDCLAVCPWNKFAAASHELRFSRGTDAAPDMLTALLALDDAAFRQRFAGTPVKRTGRDRFLRNVLIAAGNSADRSLLPAVVRLLGDASPLVRAMAVWALGELGTGDEIAEQRARRMSVETDADVLGEWRDVLS